MSAVALLGAAVVALSTLGLVAPPVSRADYGPGAEAASADGSRLGDRDSSSPTVSSDGRYVVFTTSSPILLGAPPDPREAYTLGLVRRDLVTGAVELVAPGRRVARIGGGPISPGATSGATISGNGRYVVFETTLALAPGDLNVASDVYVRDMARPVTDADAYELASALDGTRDAPSYPDPAQGSRAGQAGFAISDDGRTVAFTAQGMSNLPAGGRPTTPERQVLVRSLDTLRTALVTRRATDPGAVGTPVTRTGDVLPLPALSADGTTVVWADTDSGQQARLLPGQGEPPLAYLWRNLAAGPAAPTRFVAGAADPDDPACLPGSVFDAQSATVTGPCYGPFVVGEALDANNVLPQGSRLSLSRDGRRVVFLSSAQQRPYSEVTARVPSVYLADMTPGLPRKQAVRRIASVADGPPIAEPVLAPDGAHVVFASANRAFEGPRVIGTVPGGELATTNVFVLDLSADTVQRATVGFGGDDYRGTLLDPDAGGATRDPSPRSLAVDGVAGTIAFAAEDANLFAGDANGVLDVQVVRGSSGVSAAARTVTALPAPAIDPAPLEGAAAIRPVPPIHPVIGYVTMGAHGIARVRVRVPAAGAVAATATARAGRASMRVARTTRTLRRASTITLTLRPSRTARAAARARSRLTVTVAIAYRPAVGAVTRAARRYQLTRRAVA